MEQIDLLQKNAEIFTGLHCQSEFSSSLPSTEMSRAPLTAVLLVSHFSWIDGVDMCQSPVHSAVSAKVVVVILLEVCGAEVPLRGGGKTGGVLCAICLVSGLPWVRTLLQPESNSSLHCTDNVVLDTLRTTTCVVFVWWYSKHFDCRWVSWWYETMALCVVFVPKCWYGIVDTL